MTARPPPAMAADAFALAGDAPEACPDVAAGLAGDAALLERAATAGRRLARLWETPPGVVVPASCRRLPGFDAARDALALRGTPVVVRPSGGGAVPQGPGILNLSLAFAADLDRQPDLGDAAYRLLCGTLQRALAGLGIHADTRSVPAAFCDGRYNLAVDGRKIAGTAQHWKLAGGGRRVVLAHALILLDADPVAATGTVNLFESLAGSGRRHDPDAVTSVARCLPVGAPRAARTDLVHALRRALEDVPPT